MTVYISGTKTDSAWISKLYKLQAEQSWPYYKLKPSRRHLCGWISPVGRSLPVRWVWEWIALFFWLSAQSAALATSCQVVWLLSWSRRRGDTSPWQPTPWWPIVGVLLRRIGEGAVDHAVLHRDKGISATGLSGTPSETIEMHCAQAMPNQLDLLKELYSLWIHLLKSYKKTLFASGSHYSLNMHTVCFCQVSP